MHHLHIVTSTISADIGHARFAVFRYCSNLGEDRRNQLIGLFLTARHNGRPFQRALFTAGNAGTDKVEAFSREFTVTTNSVVEEGVTAINDDVAFIQVRLKRVDGGIRARARLHHEQNAAWCLKGLNKLLHGVVRHQLLAWVFGNNLFRLFA